MVPTVYSAATACAATCRILIGDERWSSFRRKGEERWGGALWLALLSSALFRRHDDPRLMAALKRCAVLLTMNGPMPSLRRCECRSCGRADRFADHFSHRGIIRSCAIRRLCALFLRMSDRPSLHGGCVYRSGL